ncbi:DUF5710 domain-containing protein [Bacillus gobiensis]|uniref:DUF5710 domain-containing protein n=1 Tax=Bacillus gobiensis TaxID=1441095 RepID=UPI003D1B88DB
MRYFSESGDRNFDSFQEWKRYYQNVPYAEKEKAKQEGAKWHPIRKQWYTHGYFVDSDDFAEWLDFEEEYTLFAAPHFYIASMVQS